MDAAQLLRFQILFDVEAMVGDEVHDLDDDEKESLHLGYFTQNPDEIHAPEWRR